MYINIHEGIKHPTLALVHYKGKTTYGHNVYEITSLKQCF